MTTTTRPRRRALAALAALTIGGAVSLATRAGADEPPPPTTLPPTTVPGGGPVGGSVTVRPIENLEPDAVVHVNWDRPGRNLVTLSAGICTGAVSGTGPVVSEAWGHECTNTMTDTDVTGVVSIDYIARQGTFTFTSPQGGQRTITCDPTHRCWLAVRRTSVDVPDGVFDSFSLSFVAGPPSTGTTTRTSTTTTSTTTTTVRPEPAPDPLLWLRRWLRCVFYGACSRH
jgi:hypothetical protein